MRYCLITWAVPLTLGCVLVGMAACPAAAMSPATHPAAGAATGPTTQATRRQPVAILADIQSLSAEINRVVGQADIFTDARKRQELGPKVLPLFRRALALADELSEYQSAARTNRMWLVGIMDLLGDSDAAIELDRAARSGDPELAVQGNGLKLMVRWWQAGKDPAAQAKVMTDVEALAQVYADKDFMVRIVGPILDGAADDNVRQRATDVVLKTLTSPAGKSLAEDVRAAAKLASLEGKPLTVEGIRLGGDKFSTTAWKGKVILVSVWASWYPPCREQLPRLKKAYNAYHEKGLEIVGVSCDNAEAELKAFVDKDADMPWPQLFDKDHPGQHALAKEWGVQIIPTMFLIDRKGIVRTVKASENLEELIPKLLQEGQ